MRGDKIFWMSASIILLLLEVFIRLHDYIYVYFSLVRHFILFLEITATEDVSDVKNRSRLGFELINSVRNNE